MTTKYFALDEAIIDCIKLGNREFYEIAYRGPVEAESKRLTALEKEEAPAWRIVDRRLQAMRKAGRIHYRRKSKKDQAGGWNLGKAEAA